MTTLHAPLGAPKFWTAVVEKFGGQCRCLRHCGATHPTTPLFEADAPGLMCGRIDRPGARLVVAPAEVLPDHQAVAVPVEDLRLWCAECWAARRRAAARRAVAAHADAIFQAGLFPEPDHIAPAPRGSRRGSRATSH
ncbi:hypothetical protein [Kitasatospora acidiphila]|uniref:hypothetical protein n=1 Tax=Kitasatospora acidiphila TaxID=2567942 RepID=UPI003C7440C3